MQIKSDGDDNINVKSIKKYVSIYCGTHVFNVCIEQLVWPIALKKTDV